MATVTAQLNDYRQSPRKVRIVADLVRGKQVAAALNQLAFLPKRSAAPIRKLIQSAVANAANTNVATENLFVKEIRVDKGQTMRRMMPRARGRGAPIKKRTSHVKIVLAEKEVKAAKAEKAPAAPAKKAKKTEKISK